MKLRSVLYGLLGASILALGAGEALRAAPGDSVITSLSGSYLIPVDTGGPLNNVTSLTTLAAFVGGSAVATNITSSSATAFTVGPNGTTGPGFQVDASTSSAAAGLKVTGLASLSGVKLDAIGGTNEPMWISGKGTGPVYLGGSTTTLAGVQIAQTASRVNDIVITPGATGSVVSLVAGGAGADAAAVLALGSNGAGALLLGGTTTTLAGLQIAQTASRINGLNLTPGAAGTAVALDASTAGADTNTGISIAGKGTGAILIGGATTTLAGLQVAQTASRVNDLNLVPGATGSSVALNASTAGADTNAGIDITPKGSGIVKVGGTVATCNGTTTATCQGQRFVASVTGLTTAASALSAAMTVTDASVVSSASIVICQTQGYAGTGVPVVVNVTPGTGSVAFNIQNVSTAASLNATVAVGCYVVGS